MTADKREDKLISSLMELMTEHGTDGMKEAMKLLLNEAMLLERQEALWVSKPYERSVARQGYANGFKPKVVKTRVGELELSIPKTSGVEFYASALEKGCRSERALAAAVAEDVR